MQIQPHPPEVHTGFIRRRCRNPRCGVKLKRETSDPRRAFCCRDCFERHYRKICLVCERPLRGKGRRPRRFCRQKCKSEFHRNLGLFSDLFRVPATTLPGAVRNGVRSARGMGLKIDTKRGRAPVIIAGPGADLHPLNFLPLDSETAERNRRTNAAYWIDTTAIPGNGWPIVLIGGGDFEHKLVHQRRKQWP